ncbi:serine/threonine protein phosphatase [Actinoplanes sp. NPDC089786]|uniref:serine/threonine protein phosphatase n=1 Tax=Actinoplanes sp. NPDC089786 TaxID=3155185 RepID=UPI00342A0315
MEQSLEDADRLARYVTVGTTLALLSDRRLGELVDSAAPIGSGIGGTAVLLQVEGTPVFAKRVPLTDTERQPENVMSTANHFRLPPGCQYGIGGPGFGAWRELAANAMTTGWVLEGRFGSFPLMYHWRVLPGAVAPPEEHADLERTVGYWDGSPAVRARIEAVAQSSAEVVLFLEYVPQNLHEWLTAQVALGDGAVELAAATVERDLRTAVAFMNANGLLHFDAHFRNVLTDGRRLYLADLGLATSPRFELSAAETEFLRRNAGHDGCYVTTELVNWLVAALSGAADPVAFHRKHGVEAIRRYAGGEQPANVPPAVASIIRRHAPVAAVLNDSTARCTTKAGPHPTR